MFICKPEKKFAEPQNYIMHKVCHTLPKFTACFLKTLGTLRFEDVIHLGRHRKFVFA